jgi:hypothetical protein
VLHSAELATERVLESIVSFGADAPHAENAGSHVGQVDEGVVRMAKVDFVFFVI